MKKYFLKRIYWLVLVLVFLFGGHGERAFSEDHESMCLLPTHRVEISLDGVDLLVCLPFEPDFTAVAESGEIVQSAALVAKDPYQSLLIYAVPYGLRPYQGGYPAASEGLADRYQEITLAALEEDDIVPQESPGQELFGEPVTGFSYLSSRPVPGRKAGETTITLWVVEAGERIWMLRYLRPAGADQEMGGLALYASGLKAPSLSLQNDQQAQEAGSPQEIQEFAAEEEDLPFPSWWDGDCNVGNHPDSEPLGGSYRGLPACGPRYTYKIVDFGEGAKQYEWQCPELTKRYLYLAYGTPPYLGHGKDVVNNYPEDNLDKVENGTPYKAPEPGDVISYGGPNTAYGHTSLVTESTVDSEGTGEITIIEQNATADGIRTHTVDNWWVWSSYEAVNWLQEYSGPALRADFNRDWTTDIAVYRPSNGNWYIQGREYVSWGRTGDLPVPGDYDRDGLADIAVYRPSNGKWYINFYDEPQAYRWGKPGDVPVPCDYDGSGDTEITVYRPSTGQWFRYQEPYVRWGRDGDIPVPADYDGDGTCDYAVFRPSDGKWYLKDLGIVGLGQEGDIPVPGDYDGDGAADPAVYRPAEGFWFIEGQTPVKWGYADDIPVPGDYDGDGATDIAVLRPSNGKWYIQDLGSYRWYHAGDYPLPAWDTNADGDPHQ
jgi:hypothetical protein